MASMMRKETRQYSYGFIEYRKRACHHLARGCLELGLPFEDQYIAIPLRPRQ